MAPGEADGLHGVVHYMGDPAATASGIDLRIDLGSAPDEAVDDLPTTPWPVSKLSGWDQSERFDEAWALVAATYQREVSVLANVVDLAPKAGRGRGRPSR